MEEMTSKAQDRAPLLQVMVCTFGSDGIKRVAAAAHPAMAGVEYLVSWQTDGQYPLPTELQRPDFRIITSTTRGLSTNRNVALSHATAPLLLISDDDVDYTREWLRAIIDAFNTHADTDLIAFRYESDTHPKSYPDRPYGLSRNLKHYISSIEMAFRRESVQGRILFNENFGIGAMFPAGEENVFLQDCIDAGLKCRYLPISIARHEGTTTSDRNLMLPSRPQTKGALFLHLHPRDWPLRMITHALREIPLWREGLVPSPLSYCINWLKGVRMAKRNKVYPTRDINSNRLHNE